MSSLLGDYVDFLSGPAFKSNKFTDSVDDIPLVKGDNLAQGYIKWEQSRFWPAQDVESYTKYYLYPGDIVLAMDRPWVTSGLKFARIKESDPQSLVVQRIARLRAINGMSQDFLHALIGSRNFEEYIKNIMGGTNVPHISPEQIKAYEFDVDKSSFSAIGSMYRTYTDLIENNRRRIQLLEESARLLYQEWFIHLRFPGHEQVKIIDGVPEGWEKKTLKEIATLNYGKALKADTRVPGPFPVYGSSGEVGCHEKALVTGPGIVIGRKGNVGSIFWVNTDFYPIDTVYFVTAEESSLFLYHALQHVQFINTDVAVPGLNRDMAYSRNILIPDEKNYERFLEEVQPIQNQVNKLQDYNIKLSQARDLLLPKLMSGELTV
jgi:type I restriction enzyme, S subunit